MPRTPAQIRQADVARVIRAVRQAGGGVVEVQGSVIRVVVGGPGQPAPQPPVCPPDEPPVDDAPLAVL